MALVCAKCRLGVSLAKLYITDSVWYAPRPLLSLTEFFERHAKCHAEDPWDRPEAQFFLGYESDGTDWSYDA